LYNIITSAIALVGTGVAAAAFRPLKPLLGGIKRAIDIAPALAGGPTLTTVLPYIKLLGQNMGKLTGWVSKTFTLFTTKFPIIGKFLKPLQGGLTKIKIFLNDIVKGFKKYFNPIKPGETVKYGGVGKSTLQNAPTPKNIRLARTGGAHFDTTSIAKKLLATGDKTLTKKVVGKITKLYYTIKAGDTLQKIVSKFKPQGVTADILKQLNFEHGLEVKPGHKIRVA
jgi:LysM repeat protein